MNTDPKGGAMPLSSEQIEELRKYFAPKNEVVTRNPSTREIADLQFVWQKESNGTKSLKVMEAGQLKQVYVDSDSKIYIE